jgi:hypothetical protein
MGLTRVFVLGLLVATIAGAAQAQARREGTWTLRDFRFRSGETAVELKLHYFTLGSPANPAVLVLHGTGGTAEGMLGPAFGRRPVRARPAAGRGYPLHHRSRRHRRGRLVEAVRRAAHALSPLRLRRHGGGAAPAADPGPRRQAPAAGGQQLHGRHAGLGVGASPSRVHGRHRPPGGHAGAGDRAQLDCAAHGHRHDQVGPGLEGRRLHGPAA